MTSTRLLGFGDASDVIPVTGGDTFVVNTEPHFMIFPMPYDGKIVTVSGRYSNVGAWSPTSNMQLYIAVALEQIPVKDGDPDNNTFKIQESSKALAPAYVRGTAYPNRIPRRGIAENLNIPVKKGQGIAILAGYSNTGGTVAQATPFNFSGSIVIEKV